MNWYAWLLVGIMAGVCITCLGAMGMFMLVMRVPKLTAKVSKHFVHGMMR